MDPVCSIIFTITFSVNIAGSDAIVPCSVSDHSQITLKASPTLILIALQYAMVVRLIAIGYAMLSTLIGLPAVVSLIGYAMLIKLIACAMIAIAVKVTT